jgi:hypothetical protein
MKRDQYERLQALEEKLVDVLLHEAEPDKWPGHGIDPGAMDPQTRGDRYWCKKNAVATISLVQRVGALIGQVTRGGADVAPPASTGEQPPAEDHLEDDVKAAEQEAARLLKELQQGTGKAAFDRRVHGPKAG